MRQARTWFLCQGADQRRRGVIVRYRTPPPILPYRTTFANMVKRRVSATQHFDLTLARPRLMLGDDRQLGQLGGGDADPFEAFGDDAVGSGQKADEQIHRRDAAAAVGYGALLGLAGQADD